MSDMLTFMTSMLDAIVDFLGSEPIIYIVGFILAAFTIKIIRMLFCIR